jgi:hypothetical protein
MTDDVCTGLIIGGAVCALFVCLFTKEVGCCGKTETLTKFNTITPTELNITKQPI